MPRTGRGTELPHRLCPAGDDGPGGGHYFGWYALNVLELPPHVIALHFGHQDGGELVRKNYGHPDAAISRERVREAFRQAPAPPVRIRAA